MREREGVKTEESDILFGSFMFLYFHFSPPSALFWSMDRTINLEYDTCAERILASTVGLQGTFERMI